MYHYVIQMWILIRRKSLRLLRFFFLERVMFVTGSELREIRTGELFLMFELRTVGERARAPGF